MASGGRSLSLSFRLTLIVALSVLPVLVVTGYDAVELRRNAAAEALHGVGHGLDSIYAQQVLLLENTRLLLSTLARADVVRQPDPAALHSLFSGLIEDNPLYIALLAFDPSGRMIAAASDAPAVDISDRDYFRDVKRRGVFTVGEYAISRTTGRQTIHFAYPAYSKSGALACVLVASYDLEYYGKLFGVQAMSPGSVVEVFDRKGSRLFRYPAAPSESVGERGGDEVMRLVKAGPVGSLRLSTTDFPGLMSAARFVALETSATPDFLIVLRYPEGIALAQARSIADRSVLMILCSLAIGFALLRVLMYYGVSAQCGRLVRTARRIGSGDYSLHPPIGGGPAEFESIGRTLDELAGSLQSRKRERDEAEAALRSSLSEKEILLKEIHHRVKNNFQIVSSLLSLQAGSMRDAEAIEAFAASQNRIKSMALIHEKLYQSQSLEKIDFSDYLRSMADEIASAYYDVAGRVSLDFDIERVDLPVDSAIPLGLIVNELMTNCYKYAFPGDRRGRVTLRLRAVPGPAGLRVRLEVEDDGVGLDPRAAASGGLGRELVKGLSQQLKAELSVDGSAGTRCRVEFGLGS